MFETIFIGTITMVTLIWLLVFSMTNVSDSEKRRLSTLNSASEQNQVGTTGSETRHAA